MSRNVVPIESAIWKTGGFVPISGIYTVRHSEHRLPREVTLLKGEEFPRCAGCQSAVIFRLKRALDTRRAVLRFQVHLYQLPVLEDGKRAG